MRIQIIDAFTDQPFAGNPAAVCLLDTDVWPDESWMRQVAAEMNLSETAFAHPLPERADADWALRWFTPTVEADLCGHATLATAHALHSDRGDPGTVRFRSRSGVLITHTHHDGSITLDFPSAPATEVPLPDGLTEALNAKPDTTYSTDALGDLLAVFPDEAGIRALTPDFTALARLARRDGLRGIIATARTADSGSGYDFVSRFFAPAQGIPEDPVTGSAHTALAPTGRSAWAGTASPGCRYPPVPAWSVPPSTTTACTSPGTLSLSSTAPGITAPDKRTSQTARSGRGGESRR
jgi:PhzF family phenazine biosynthesis protein